MSEYREYKPGDPVELSADEWNRRYAEIERRGNVSVSGPLTLSQMRYGRVLSMTRDSEHWARLGGSSSPYSFQEVRFDGSSWAVVSGGYTGTSNAYEVNRTGGLSGKIIWMVPGYPGDWRFQWIAKGNHTNSNAALCTTFTVQSFNMTGSPYPGIAVEIIGSSSTPLASGTTDASGVFTWSGSGGLFARAKTPDSKCSAPMNFASDGNGNCTAGFKICKSVVKVTVENGGSLTINDCMPCEDLTGDYVREGSTYTWTDYGIYSADGYYLCGGPVARSLRACSQGDLWGGCATVTGICDQTVDATIHTWPKSDWNHNVNGGCANDRSHVIPKTLYMTMTGPNQILGGNSGTCLTLQWDPTSWNGDPCTYDTSANSTSVMAYYLCAPAAGAYGMCGRDLYGAQPNFQVAGYVNKPYGSASVSVIFDRGRDRRNTGCFATYTPKWAGSCPNPDPAPKCGPSNVYTAHSAMYCVATVGGIQVYQHQMPDSIAFGQVVWSGSSATSGEFLGFGPISLHGNTVGNCTDGDTQGFTYCCGTTATPSTVVISESCGDYMVPLGGRVPSSGAPPLRPAGLRRSGQIRVGLLAPVFVQGGAEAHMISLVRTIGPATASWRGCVVTSDKIDPDMRATMESLMPFGVGCDNARALASDCDVLITWAIDGLTDILDGLPSPPRIVSVVHAPVDSPWGQSAYSCADGIDRWVAVSELAMEAIPAASLAAAPASVIWNAVDETRLVVGRDRAAMRESWGVPADALVVGYLGRLSHEKHPEKMIEIARAIPSPWHVVVVGDGFDRSSLEIQAAGVDRFHLVGPDTGAGDVLNAFDVLVVPSHHESFGLTIAEGLWMGVPVVSTPVGLAKIVPGLTRPIAQDAGGPEIVAAILADAVDTARTRERIEHARSFARERLSAERFGREWSAYLGSITPPSPGPTIATQQVRIDPAVRDAVLACPDRGSVLPVSMQPACGCGEYTSCFANKGARPGMVMLRECIACKTEELSR